MTHKRKNHQTVNFELKYKCKDFEVTEVPLFPRLLPKSRSTYTYFWLQKRGLTTFDAIDIVKSFFKLEYSDISTEGLKDEDAITSQILSIKKVIADIEIQRFNKAYKEKKRNILIRNVLGYGTSPVTKRCLHGNCFKIIICKIKKDKYY